MSLTLGEKLRQAREERGISISEVAEQTRISPHYLASIENDDYRTLPGGIFNKGFVKSYAKYVGLDEQEALADYSRLIASQEGTSDDEPKTYKPEVLTDDRTSGSTLPTIIFAAIILGLMAWGLITLVNYIQNNQSQTASNTNTANNTASANSNTAIANVAPTIPAVNEIKVEIKSLVDKINVTSIVDGKKLSEDILLNASKTYTGQQSVKIAYYRGFTPDKVQVSVNGKQIPAPNPPVKGSTTSFEINKENIVQILQSGQLLSGDAAATPAATATPAAVTQTTATPVKPTPVKPTPAKTIPANPNPANTSPVNTPR
ncbi:MAG TPA: helix-turn-helix domain-containing protein [Pyrinomonadaceae bacterium]|jgi:cytoskeletal protein RodZ|nr:helix-turn-helix domain-containing protein [Pyrinomonadaceae bacterium]